MYLPTKTLKIDPRVQAFWLTIGHLALSVAIFIFVAQPFSFSNALMPFIAGVLWAVGIYLAYVGIKHIGITRGFGIWIPTIIVTSFLWGLIFFGEAKVLGPQRLTQTAISALLLILAAFAVILSSKGESKLGNFKVGVLASLGIGLIHGSFFVPLRASSLPIFVTFLPLTLGMVAATSAIILRKKLRIRYDQASTLRMILAGIIIGGGNYTAVLTTQYLGVAQGYPLTQLGIIVNALWGTLVFKEVTTQRGKILIAISIVIALAGAILLNSARI